MESKQDHVQNTRELLRDHYRTPIEIVCLEAGKNHATTLPDTGINAPV